MSVKRRDWYNSSITDFTGFSQAGLLKAEDAAKMILYAVTEAIDEAEEKARQKHLPMPRSTRVYLRCIHQFRKGWDKVVFAVAKYLAAKSAGFLELKYDPAGWNYLYVRL